MKIPEITKIIKENLFLSDEVISSFIRTAPHRYKTYEIKKRNSNEKRTIAHPSKEVKLIQRMTLKILDSYLPISNKAFGYRDGVSIRDNALEHSNSNFLLKMDIKDFFNSITPNVFFNELSRNNIFITESSKVFLRGCLFYYDKKNPGLKLSVGAPSSPFISNFIMYLFDIRVHGICRDAGITYTRYADDMTFSTKKKGVLLKFDLVIKKIIEDEYDGCFKINENKTIHSSKKHNRHITGITLTNDDGISLGRERKRKISAKINDYRNGKLSESEIFSLKGLISFCNYVEPLFIVRMIHKYGEETIKSIKSYGNT